MNWIKCLREFNLVFHFTTYIFGLGLAIVTKIAYPANRFEFIFAFIYILISTVLRILVFIAYLKKSFQKSLIPLLKHISISCLVGLVFLYILLITLDLSCSFYTKNQS